VNEVTTLQGPVEKIDGKLALRIPLEAGGDQFIDCTRRISQVDSQFLIIFIPEWLAGSLRIEEGSVVSVDNANAKFNVRPIEPLPVQ
jgi:hypothetical protein